MNEEASTYTVIGLDVISYSTKELKDQVAAQRLVDRCLDSAINRNWKWAPNDVHWIDAGDGGFLLLNGHADVAISTIADFQQMVNVETENWDSEKRVLFRYALHSDLVMRWDGTFGSKFTGNALNDCARLLNGMNKEQVGQVICSGNFLDSVEAFGKIPVNKQRLTDTIDKHGQAHRRFNLFRTPEFGVPALEREINDDPTER